MYHPSMSALTWFAAALEALHDGEGYGTLCHCIKSRADALANLPDPGKVAPRKRDVA